MDDFDIAMALEKEGAYTVKNSLTTVQSSPATKPVRQRGIGKGIGSLSLKRVTKKANKKADKQGGNDNGRDFGRKIAKKGEDGGAGELRTPKMAEVVAKKRSSLRKHKRQARTDSEPDKKKRRSGDADIEFGPKHDAVTEQALLRIHPLLPPPCLSLGGARS